MLPAILTNPTLKIYKMQYIHSKMSHLEYLINWSPPPFGQPLDAMIILLLFSEFFCWKLEISTPKHLLHIIFSKLIVAVLLNLKFISFVPQQIYFSL